MKQNLLGTCLVFFIILFAFFEIEGFVNPLRDTITEIEDNEFVEAVGIDKTGAGAVRVTDAFPDFESQSPSANSQQKISMKLLSCEGDTVFEAHRSMHQFVSKNLHYGHIDWVILGEGAAYELADSLDFEMRDKERGFSTNVAIVKGASAEEFLSTAAKQSDLVSNMISGLRQESDNISISCKVNFADIMAEFSKNNSVFFIPFFTLTETKIVPDYNQQEKQIISSGLAVIKDKKLLGFLTQELSRGVNWVLGKIKSDSIVVKGQNGNAFSLEVLSAHASIKTSFELDKPKVDIAIRVVSELREVPIDNELPTEQLIHELEVSQKEEIEAEVLAALDYAKLNGVDLFGLGDKIEHQHPILWRSIEGSWEEIMPQTPVSVKIESMIKSIGVIDNIE